MSMSQEEIEALMSGADDIQVDDVEEENNDSEDSISSDSEENETPSESESTEEAEEINVDDILAGIDGIVDDEDDSEINVDDILAGIDGIVDEEENPSDDSNNSEVQEMEEKINTSQYPLPVSDENKVVNQLK